MLRQLPFGFELMWGWRGSDTAQGYRTYFYGIARYAVIFGFVICPED